MAGKKIGVVWMICGLLIILLSLGADLIGIGDLSGIGWKQLLGAGAGLVIGLVGFWLTRFKTQEKK